MKGKKGKNTVKLSTNKKNENNVFEWQTWQSLAKSLCHNKYVLAGHPSFLRIFRGYFPRQEILLALLVFAFVIVFVFVFVVAVAISGSCC